MSFVVTEPITEGVAVLHTSFGDVLVELWKRECPKAVRNFVQLALEGHYDGVPFHRIAPGFIAQAGGSDDCIYDEGDFPIETNQRLKFNRRGLLAMASDPNTKTNMSQFFFTLDATPNLQNQHTLFGRVSGDSLFNLLKLNDTEIEPGTEDKPVYPPTIKSIEIRLDPFEDDADPIRPRITAAERKEQERAKREMKAERAKQREQGKRKGTKNKSLISFGDEAEEDESLQSSLPKTKFKSAHDALPNDSRLSAKVVDDRGFSVELPPELMGPPPSAAGKAAGSKRRKEDEGEGREEKRSRPEPSTSTSKLDEARKARDKAPKSEAEKRKEEIAKVQAELKKMTGKPTSDDDESSASSSKKKKRTGPSLLQLEREKYLSRGGGASSSRGGKKAKGGDEDVVLSVLEGFRSRLSEAAKVGPKKKEGEKEEEKERLHGIDLNDDELDDDLDDWMLHSLKFRKDATEDFHKLSDYAVVDPLAKNDKTLEELKSRAESQRRRYAGEERDRGSGGRGGGGGRGGYEDRRRGGGGGGGGGRYDDRRGGGGGGGGRSEQYGSGSRDRPEVRGGDWKKDRVSTADLA